MKKGELRLSEYSSEYERRLILICGNKNLYGYLTVQLVNYKNKHSILWKQSMSKRSLMIKKLITDIFCI